MENIVLIAAVMGLTIGALGYYYAKGANGLFMLMMGAIGFGAVYHLKFTGEIHELSTGVGESLTVELQRKLGWIFEIYERLPAELQTAILTFIGAFVIARLIAWVARSNRGVQKEPEKRRRKRVLKSFGMKNMKELRRHY